MADPASGFSLGRELLGRQGPAVSNHRNPMGIASAPGQAGYLFLPSSSPSLARITWPPIPSVLFLIALVFWGEAGDSG